MSRNGDPSRNHLFPHIRQVERCSLVTARADMYLLQGESVEDVTGLGLISDGYTSDQWKC